MPASLTIVPAGQTLTVNVYLANGSTAATCYTTADLTTAVTFPATVTSTTTYWVRTNDYYVVSALQTDGSEIANGNAGVWSGYVTSGAPRRIEPSPTYAQVAADDANLSGTYARSRRSVFQAGRKWLFVGTSITNGSNAGNVVYAFPQQATQMAGTYLASSSSVIAGTPGATVTQNAAALPALLTTHAPDAVFIETGPNIGGGTLSGFQDAVASMVAIVKATGAAVVVTTPSPVKGATATVGAQLLLRQYSLWLNLWGPANGVQVADFYGTLLDSTTGLLSATFDSGDDLHPNALGHSRLAQVAAAAMLAVSTSGLAVATRAAGLTGGLVTNPLLASAGSTPTGSTANPGNTGTGATNTIETTDSTGRRPSGNWAAVAVNALATTSQGRVLPMSATGWAIGDTVAICGYVEVTDNAARWETDVVAGNAQVMIDLLNQSYTGLGSAYSRCVGRVVGAGVYAIGPAFTTVVIPAGTTTLQLGYRVALPTGGNVTARFAVLDVINLTALGLTGL